MSPEPPVGEIEVPLGADQVMGTPATPRPKASTVRTRIESAVDSAGESSVSCVATTAAAGPTAKAGDVRNGANRTALPSSAARPRLSLPANPMSGPNTSPHQLFVATSESPNGALSLMIHWR